ncbi:MAG: DM13 domain-containing protein [Salinibacter sp.]
MNASSNAYTLPVFLLTLMLLLGCGLLGGQENPGTAKDDVRLDTVLVKGTFVGKEGITTTGSYRIGRTGSDLKLVLGEDFRTEKGPDLYVVLSPKTRDEATGENVMEGAAVRVHALRSLKGQQVYDLADDLDLKPFNATAIQCIQFSHLYGAAPLE